MSPGTCWASFRRRSWGTGSNALTTSSDAPVSFASWVAWPTATAAVSDPSVPTTMRLNTEPSSTRSLRRHTNRVPSSWTVSIVILVVCLLASMVIAITKLA